MNATVKNETVRGKTILLVEDHEVVRTMVKDVLRRDGFEVFAYSDGREALSCFRECRDVVDLIVTDVIMPELDGKALAQKCREQRPDIGVLYMSSRLEGGFNLDDELRGNADFIGKPFRPAELLERVKKLVDAEERES